MILLILKIEKELIIVTLATANQVIFKLRLLFKNSLSIKRREYIKFIYLFVNVYLKRLLFVEEKKQKNIALHFPGI